MSANENRPAGHNGAALNTQPTDLDSTPRHDSVLAAAAGYAVLVETGEGRYRRRLFLTLASAERAVDRARGRGQYAHLVLCQIIPTGVVA